MRPEGRQTCLAGREARGEAVCKLTLRTLSRHSELDPLHAADFDEQLDQLPLTREQAAVIGLSGIYTVQAFTRVLEDLFERAG